MLNLIYLKIRASNVIFVKFDKQSLIDYAS